MAPAFISVEIIYSFLNFNFMPPWLIAFAKQDRITNLLLHIVRQYYILYIFKRPWLAQVK